MRQIPYIISLLATLSCTFSINHNDISTDSDITSKRRTPGSSLMTYDPFSTHPDTNDRSTTLAYDSCSTNLHPHREGSHHQSMEFTCTSTLLDNDVCMVNKCPTNFYEQQIAYYCQTYNETELLLDFRLSIPVTSQETNITYRNVFCAYCNDERHYTFWTVRLLCTLPSKWLEKLTSDSISSNLRVDENRKTLVSNVNNTLVDCSIHGSIPSELEGSIDICTIPVNNTLTETEVPAFSEEVDKVFTMGFYQKNLPRFIDYKIVNSFIFDKKMYFQFDHTSSFGNQGQESCFPSMDRQSCKKIHHAVKGEYAFINNEIILNKTGYTFDSSEWCESFNKNVIILCQVAKKDTDFVVSYTCIRVMMVFSIIFFFLLLWALGTNKKKWQCLPNKVIFSYSLTMVALQIVTSASFWSPSCNVVGPVIHYLRLSRYVWLSILAFDFWRMIYYSYSALEKVAKRPQLKRFSIYCFIGWVSPLSILSVALYSEFANSDNTNCNIAKPEYGKDMFCRMTQTKAIEYFENYPVYVASFIVIVLFVYTFYLMYLLRKQTYIDSWNRKNNCKILVKLAWTLGLAFIIALFSAFFQNPYYRVLFSIFDQSQGIILYFIHGHKYVIKSVKKMRRGSIESRTVFTRTSVYSTSIVNSSIAAL